MYDCLLYELVINLIKFTMIKSTFVLYFVFAEIVFKMYHFNLISIFFCVKQAQLIPQGFQNGYH